VVGAFAIIILTEWDQFKALNYRDYFEIMERPAYIFDGRNILDEKSLRQIGYNYYRIGKACTN
jgi:UDPglucose 6-dehydrogenase